MLYVGIERTVPASFRDRKVMNSLDCRESKLGSPTHLLSQHREIQRKAANVKTAEREGFLTWGKLTCSMEISFGVRQWEAGEQPQRSRVLGSTSPYRLVLHPSHPVKTTEVQPCFIYIK